MEEYKYFTSIYPDWCKERQARYKNTLMVEFIDKIIITKLKELSKLKHNFNLIKCPDSPIISVFKDIDSNPDKNYLILSRDPHYSCIWAYHNIAIYNGKELVSRNDYLGFPEYYPTIHHTLIPHFYLIAGMKRNEYHGLDKYGPKKTLNLLKKEYTSIIDESNEIYEKISQYKNLFFLKLLPSL